MHHCLGPMSKMVMSVAPRWSSGCKTNLRGSLINTHIGFIGYFSLEAPLSRPGTKEVGLVLHCSHADDHDIGRFLIP